MASTPATQSSGGPGLGAILTIVFVVLKLVGDINWSWVWVLSPLWISLAFVVLIMLAWALAVAIFGRE